MQEHAIFKPTIFLFASLFFGSWINSAQASVPLPARFSANGYASDSTVGQADFMLSLEGDQEHNLYVDPQAAYGSDQQWFADLGLGYRWIKNNSAILGWYMFAGHTRLDHNSGFWIANPGVEAMGSRWDAHINGYIPLAGRSDEVGNVELNIISDPVFRGHSLIVDSVFNNAHEIQRIGNGADARLAYQLFRHVPLKAYVGAYFFDIPGTDKLRGGAAGFEYWFDRNVKFFANYTYDNYQQSTVASGLGISFGGVRKQMTDPALSERLMDPVERYLANLGHASGIPSRTFFFGEGNGNSSQIVLDNIAFFSQTGTPNTGGTSLTLSNCTFESPCGPTDFSQTGVNTLNGLLPDTTIYFNGGTYPATNGASGLTLNNGQGIFSRTTDYSAPASGSARSTFNGGFVLAGNNQLNSIILNNTLGPTGTAISVINGQNIEISNSQIGNAGNPYPNGVSLDNANQVIVDNSTIFVESSGIDATNSSFILQSSILSASDTLGVDTVAIFIDTSSHGEINDSQVIATGTGDNVGVEAFNSTVLINNSDIKVGVNTNSNLQTALITTTPTSTIQMNGGNLAISGSNINNDLVEGSNITLNAVTCTNNGTTVICP